MSDGQNSLAALLEEGRSRPGGWAEDARGPAAVRREELADLAAAWAGLTTPNSAAPTRGERAGGRVPACWRPIPSRSPACSCASSPRASRSSRSTRPPPSPRSANCSSVPAPAHWSRRTPRRRGHWPGTRGRSSSRVPPASPPPSGLLRSRRTPAPAASCSSAPGPRGRARPCCSRRTGCCTSPSPSPRTTGSGPATAATTRCRCSTSTPRWWRVLGTLVSGGEARARRALPPHRLRRPGARTGDHVGQRGAGDHHDPRRRAAGTTRSPATVRFVRSASAPLPVPVLERFEARWGVPVVETYGMTEAASQITANPLDGPRARLGRRAGRGRAARATTRAARVDPRRRRGPGYEDGAGADRFDAQGWLDTGDVGAARRRRLPVPARAAAATRSTGAARRSSRGRSRRCCAGTPAVRDAVVVARPDPVLGEVPVAFVVRPACRYGAGRRRRWRPTCAGCARPSWPRPHRPAELRLVAGAAARRHRQGVAPRAARARRRGDRVTGRDRR